MSVLTIAHSVATAHVEGAVARPSMRRAYKLRLRPTTQQHVALRQCLDAHRELYNALQERRDAYEQVVRRAPNYWSTSRPKGPVGFASQSAQLPEIKASRAEIARWGAGSGKATLRRLNRAFDAFFQRAKAGQEPGYPRFKPAHRFDSVDWPSPGDACKWHPEVSRVYLQGIGHVKVSVHRPVEGKLKTISVKRKGRRWFLVLLCDAVPVKPLEPTGSEIGIDLGIASFATTSDVEHIANPRHGRRATVGRPPGWPPHNECLWPRSGDRRTGTRPGRLLPHCTARSPRCRDVHHQVARHLITDHDVLCVEDLKIKNMTRSAKGTMEAPGTNVAAKSGLNRSITDAGWGQFLSILKGKAEEAGRPVIDVDRRHTSQTCAQCRHVDPGNRVTQAVFRCLAYGHQAHADVNAACNILRAGLARPAARAA
ncbi:MAG: RNA-guided endonuclease InsQ/TnpB family protein [Acidimicrobiales bacterium]